MISLRKHFLNRASKAALAVSFFYDISFDSLSSLDQIISSHFLEYSYHTNLRSAEQLGGEKEAGLNDKTSAAQPSEILLS